MVKLQPALPVDYLLMAEKKAVQATKLSLFFSPGDLMVMESWFCMVYFLGIVPTEASCGLLSKT
jgi:hypothetical protein